VQVMRKKPDTLPVVTNTPVVKKIISKRPRPNTANVRERPSKHTTTHSQQLADTPFPPTDSGGSACHDLTLTTESVTGSVGGDVGDDICSNEGGTRERSVTPTESDLLKYLTAHITPSEPGCFTSFVISREEYLQGIVQLVKSDCPEVMADMDCFMQAMQQAYTYTNDMKNES
jgi:hypothetical protein